MALLTICLAAGSLSGQAGPGDAGGADLDPAVSLLPPADALLPAPSDEPLHTATYLEVTGDERVRLVAREWQTPEGLFLESVSSTGDRHVVLVDAELRTQGWRFENEPLASVVQATRAISREAERGPDSRADGQSTVVQIAGIAEGDQVRETTELPEPLWIQSLERSLRGFVLSGSPGDRLRFSVVQPDTLSSRRLEARIMEDDDVEIGGAPVRARRVRISLPGIGVIVWRSNYWFRLPDGLFVLSRVTRGPPGTPETVVVLTSEGAR